jgi:large conductance mechanosensitive channel
LIREFREFAIRGNVVDLAVGVVIGAAFGKIVESLVKDVIMPPIGLALGRVDFSNLFLVLKDGMPTGPYGTVDAAQKAGAVTLNLGLFINTLIAFMIIAFAIFMLVKLVQRLRRKHEQEAPKEPTEEVLLLREIRDALKR